MMSSLPQNKLRSTYALNHLTANIITEIDGLLARESCFSYWYRGALLYCLRQRRPFDETLYVCNKRTRGFCSDGSRLWRRGLLIATGRILNMWYQRYISHHTCLCCSHITIVCMQMPLIIMLQISHACGRRSLLRSTWVFVCAFPLLIISFTERSI